MEKLATIIINRNLPLVTNTMFNTIKKYNKNYTDIFVVEAGSKKKNLSKISTWHANWPKARKEGLRYGRGANYALSNLYKEDKFKNYKGFIITTNDIFFEKKPFVKKILKIFKNHPRLGILSMSSSKWGENQLLKKHKTKYFWHIDKKVFVFRREFIEDIMNLSSPGYLNFLLDGKNFRGLGTESEIVAKAYLNGWAAGITSEVKAEKISNFYKKYQKKIITENADIYNKKTIQEGFNWMKNKYGFKSKWAMTLYVKNLYENFFIQNPEFIDYKL